MAQSPGPAAVANIKAKNSNKTKKRRNRNRKNKGQGTGGVTVKPSAEHSCSPCGSDASDFSESEDEGNEGYRKGGYHPVYLGERYKDGRYLVRRKLGWGHFSTVWLAYDEEKREEVALKVQKSASHYTEAAYDEITLLKQISEGDPGGEQCCCALKDSFEHAGPHGQHVCMVFEVLGDNLLSLIKRYNYRGMPLSVVKGIVRQILVGLHYIHSERSIIHTDLKPENILLTSQLPPLPNRKKKPALRSPAETEAAPASGQQGGQLDAAPEAARADEDEPAALVSSEELITPATPEASEVSGISCAEDLVSSASSALTKNQKKKLKRKQKQLKATKTEDLGDVLEEPAPSPEGAAPAAAAACPPGADSHSGGKTDAWGTQPPEVVTGAGATGAEEGAGLHPSKSSEFAAALDAPEEDGEGEAEEEEVEEEEGAECHNYRRWHTGTTGLTAQELLSLECKVVDFGNACWTYKQFTNDIQTRQYRCPEVIIGAKYSTSADIWSLACITFELATGDLLFDPRSGDNYDRDEDHLALFMELLGRIPKKVALGGKYSRDFFNRHGELRHIRKLRFWPLERVLVEKYDFDSARAQELAAFLVPMLDFVPERRATAGQMLDHPWLQPSEEEEQAAAPPKSPSPAERTSLDKAMSCWAEASTVLVPPPVDLYENQSVEHSEGEMSGEWELVDHE
mmetsp:Transcript_23744/g.45235  ORF Transcript_23744/g.45235 Transcript_23744/m.45235 type:complete len:684 (-) Transcript_23744:144-2195(-)